MFPIYSIVIFSLLIICNFICNLFKALGINSTPPIQEEQRIRQVCLLFLRNNSNNLKTNIRPPKAFGGLKISD